jgi:hypothetical protein
MSFGDIANYIPLVLIAAALIAMVIWQVGGSQRGEKARVEGARSRGWTYEKIKETPRLTRYVLGGRTSDGVPWQIEGVVSLSNSSSESTGVTYTRWFTDALSDTDNIVLIGPKPGSMPPGFDFGGGLAQQFLRMVLRNMPDAEPGDQARFAALQKIEVGTETFKDSYVVFATDESAAHELLDGDVESRLIEWAMSEKKADRLPMIVVWHHGIQIRLDENRSADMAAMDQLAALGEGLVRQRQTQI